MPDAKPSSFVCEGCDFVATKESFFKTGTYAIGTIRFERCRIKGFDGACKAFVDLFDWRPSEGDAWPGTVEFRECTVGDGVSALVGCTTIKANGYLKPGTGPTKKLAFVFEGNALVPGAVERAGLPPGGAVSRPD